MFDKKSNPAGLRSVPSGSKRFIGRGYSRGQLSLGENPRTFRADRAVLSGTCAAALIRLTSHNPARQDSYSMTTQHASEAPRDLQCDPGSRNQLCSLQRNSSTV